jgi:hypothetical protein
MYMAGTQKMPVVLSRVRLAAAVRMPDGYEPVGRGFGEAHSRGDRQSSHEFQARFSLTGTGR